MMTDDDRYGEPVLTMPADDLLLANVRAVIESAWAQGASLAEEVMLAALACNLARAALQPIDVEPDTDTAGINSRLGE